MSNNNVSVLFIGESWFVHTVESKGFDFFSFDSYDTGIQYIQKALSGPGFSFTHLPCHLVETEFPATVAELREKYDVILISDIGTNTFLLPMKTFLQAETTPNKLEMMKEFVELGGGLGMIGGYLTYMGYEGKGKYKNTAIEEILPVTLQTGDDRQELPQGYSPDAIDLTHPLLAGFPEEWPLCLGYNKVTAKLEATVLASYRGDPCIALGSYGKGRTLAYTTDCAPHWSPEAFCSWPYYNTLWQNLVGWLASN